jgi:predicted PurR-regulated permease PerM
MAAAANVIVVLFAIYLMLLSGDSFKRKLMTVVSSQTENGNLSRKRITIEILNEIAAQFQRYLGVLAVTNVVIGLLIWAAFAMVGVEHAAVWGVAAAVLHIIPYVGPAVIAVASMIVTALQFDSLGQGLLSASVALIIFGLIGMLFQTWLAGRASSMNSVAVFTGLMFWGWLWGIAGLLLGTPLMMAMKVVADRVECLHWLATFLSDGSKRDRKPQISAANEAATLPGNAAAEGVAMPAIAASAITAETAVETAAIANDAAIAPDHERKEERESRAALESLPDESLLPA